MPWEVLHQKTEKVLVITTLYKLGLVGKRAKTKEKTEWKKNLITELQLLLTNSPSSSDVVSAILRYKAIGPGEYRIREYRPGLAAGEF